MLGRIESPAFTISRNLRRAVLIRTGGGNPHGGWTERVAFGRAGRAGCAGWRDACVRWALYDIAVENISLIANYRAQFDRIIRSASYQDLVTRLKTKREEFLQEARPGSS